MKTLHELAYRAVEKSRSRLEVLKCIPIKWEMKAAYERGRANCDRLTKTVETVDPLIVETADSHRRKMLERYRFKYSSEKLRILFHRPPNGVGVVWFNDLMQCLEYTGISCASIPWGDPLFRQKWEAFCPNVFVSMDCSEVLRGLDLDYISEYKSAYGCIRLFTPIVKSRFPAMVLSSEDLWRLELACSGKSADAYFSMMVDEFFRLFLGEWVNAGFQYLSLPHGCNPLTHYPVVGSKDLDFAMATSCGPERIILTQRYMKRIFEQYHGAWAGPGWGFGLGPIQPKEIPFLYARARIVPNPLSRYLVRYPCEITERAFSAMACGGFQITDYTPVTRRFFDENELVCVKDEYEFEEAFDYYVERPDERNRVLLKGMNRVFRDHTYFHRIDSLIAFLRRIENSSPAPVSNPSHEAGIG